jgi:hypothetical protein
MGKLGLVRGQCTEKLAVGGKIAHAFPFSAQYFGYKRASVAHHKLFAKANVPR